MEFERGVPLDSWLESFINSAIYPCIYSFIIHMSIEYLLCVCARDTMVSKSKYGPYLLVA